MRSKKKTVEQEKNRNSQKSVKSVQLMGSVYGGNDFWKRYVFSLEWKSEGVMDDDSGYSEEDENNAGVRRLNYQLFFDPLVNSSLLVLTFSM